MLEKLPGLFGQAFCIACAQCSLLRQQTLQGSAAGQAGTKITRVTIDTDITIFHNANGATACGRPRTNASFDGFHGNGRVCVALHGTGTTALFSLPFAELHFFRCGRLGQFGAAINSRRGFSAAEDGRNEKQC